MEGVGGEDTIGNTESLLRQFSKEDVGGEEKMETLTCEDGVSDVSNVGFSVCKQNHQQIVGHKPN